MPKKKAAKTKNQTTAGKRKVELVKYKSLRLNKRIKSDKSDLPNALRVLTDAFAVFKANWKVLLGLAIIYQLLVTVLVRNFGISVGLSDLRQEMEAAVEGGNQAVTGAVLFGTLLSSGSSAATETGGVYQMILIIIFSLAFIWSLRNIAAKQSVSVKAALYQGMYPLVPFVLVLLVISIQLLPMAAATYVYSVVISAGIAVNAAEHVIWFLLTLLFTILSLYMVTSSIFALYIVTLPNTKPVQALRAARDLVRHRRFAVLRKLIFLPIALVIIGGGLMIPVIVFATWSAEWIFYVLAAVGLVVAHVYLYGLYRKLIL